ncbi:RHS repeat-associated core domain-containing protein, partial [Undibacterium sp. TJN19]|uniref:RHS repeat-associated core domain-containing protein n=1 Tax=Undibacterium sp. TJN19 TaxID=3413055 RepID=UPI003BF2CD9B
SNVVANSYSITAKATDSKNATTSSAPVTVNVVNNNAPTVSLTANPVNATAPATIILNATAADSDGSIAKVEFYNGGSLLSTVTTAPYRFNWNDVAGGTYSLTAKATDNLGASRISTPVTVTVAGHAVKMYDIHTDYLDTPRVITDSSGVEVWRWDSAPFGETLPNEQPTNATSKFTFNIRFAGQYFDQETGLHYNYFRDYDPRTGRYVESDPIGLAGGMTTYGYVGANPVSLVDARGLDWSSDLSRATSGSNFDPYRSSNFRESLPSPEELACMKKYIHDNFGGKAADWAVPNLSFLSYIPGEGNMAEGGATEQWKSGAETGTEKLTAMQVLSRGGTAMQSVAVTSEALGMGGSAAPAIFGLGMWARNASAAIHFAAEYIVTPASVIATGMNVAARNACVCQKK